MDHIAINKTNVKQCELDVFVLFLQLEIIRIKNALGVHIPIKYFKSAKYIKHDVNADTDIKNFIRAFYCLLGYNVIYKDDKGETHFFANKGQKRDAEAVSNENYKLEWHKNDIFEFLEEVVNHINDNNSNYDALLFGWSGHGEANDILIASDKNEEESQILINSVMKYFNDKNCPKLVDKLKIFFIAACRGVSPEGKVPKKDHEWPWNSTEEKQQTVVDALRLISPQTAMKSDTKSKEKVNSSDNMEKKNDIDDSKDDSKNDNDDENKDDSKDTDNGGGPQYEIKLKNPLTDDPYFISIYSTKEFRRAPDGKVLFYRLRQSIQKSCKPDPQNPKQFKEQYDLKSLLYVTRQYGINKPKGFGVNREYIDYDSFPFRIYFDKHKPGLNLEKQKSNSGSTFSFSSIE